MTADRRVCPFCNGEVGRGEIHTVDYCGDEDVPPDEAEPAFHWESEER